MTKHFVTSCVGSTAALISPMVESERNITRRTFRKYVAADELRKIEQQLGYSDHPRRGLTMAGDCHVAYYRSKFGGQPCVFFRWSGIEYVFV